MTNMTCRNVRRDIEAAGSVDFLNAGAHAHLQSCESCATLAAKQTNLASIMSSLGTVEAPGDFDFRLRARLAAERQLDNRLSRGNFSFGFRFAAVAMMLLAAAAIMLVGYRNIFNTQVDQPHQAANTEAVSPTTAEKTAANPSSKELAVVPTEDVAPIDAPSKRRARPDAVATKGTRISTKDSASNTAAVLKRQGQLAETYPDGSFPINASYQSLKVKVDDGHGSFRTISLPTVSFGSQRTVSKDAAPLMASARGVW